MAILEAKVIQYKTKEGIVELKITEKVDRMLQVGNKALIISGKDLLLDLELMKSKISRMRNMKRGK